ncbi:MAG TPA: hypothetical protein VI895_04125 [Bdellovibrionota bacterium]|nr:hypothetical protein [Bdellovibrionota bacterium]
MTRKQFLLPAFLMGFLAACDGDETTQTASVQIDEELRTFDRVVCREHFACDQTPYIFGIYFEDVGAPQGGASDILSFVVNSDGWPASYVASAETPIHVDLFVDNNFFAANPDLSNGEVSFSIREVTPCLKGALAPCEEIEGSVEINEEVWLRTTGGIEAVHLAQQTLRFRCMVQTAYAELACTP